MEKAQYVKWNLPVQDQVGVWVEGESLANRGKGMQL